MFGFLGVSYYTLFTRSKNYLDRDLDCNQDSNPDDVPVLIHGTFIVQYNKAHYIVVNCSVIVTSQSTEYLDLNYLDRDPDGSVYKRQKYIHPDRKLDGDLDNFSPSKRGL